MNIEKITPELVLKHLFLDQYTKGYQAVNPVYSGFNTVCRDKLGVNPIEITKGLQDAGLLNISGRKSIKEGKTSKSVILWLTEKGMDHFGIRPPTAGAKAPVADKKSDKLLEAVAKRFVTA
jgi:hypothetical protein